MALYFHRKHTPPPSVLLLTISKDTDRDDHAIPSTRHRSRQQNKRPPLPPPPPPPPPPPHMIGLHVNNVEIHDTSSSSYGWQKYIDKTSQISLAPDVAYRNRYLEETKQEKFNVDEVHNHSSSISPRSQKSARSKLDNSLSYLQTELTSPKDHSATRSSTIYDYIRASIREIERRRNFKQYNISSRVKRPQNEDSTLRRILGEKKSSGRTSISRSSTTTATATIKKTMSTVFNNDLKSPQSFVNYINYSREFHSTT